MQAMPAGDHRNTVPLSVPKAGLGGQFLKRMAIRTGTGFGGFFEQGRLRDNSFEATGRNGSRRSPNHWRQCAAMGRP